MSSRHRHKRSHSRDSRKEASPSKRRKSSEKQDKLDAILASLTDLKSDILSCNARICEIEAKNAVFEAVFSNQFATGDVSSRRSNSHRRIGFGHV